MSHICDGRDLLCASCVAIARRLDTVRAAMTTDDELDDVKRVRIWTRLEDRLAEVGSPRRSRAPIAIGAAAAVAVAAGGLFLALARDEDRRTLSIPAGTEVTSRLGPHTFASLVGPAQLDILGVPADTTTIRLRSGSLLADFAGGAGRALRIEAPHATIDVVGTLFAVTVHDRETCASVAHGRVRVTLPAGVLYVVGGQRYCTGDAIGAIDSDTREALTRHARIELAARGAAEPTQAQPAEPTPGPVAVPSAHDESRVLPVTPVTPAATTTVTTPTTSSPPSVPPAPPRAPGNEPRVVASGSTERAAQALRSPERPAGPSGSSRASATALTPSGREPRTHDDSPPPRSDSRLDSIRGSLSVPAAQPREEPAAPAAQPVLSPEELYRAAETALAARDLATADARLAQIIEDHRSSPLVDQALYERARIAYQQHAWERARTHLARLAAIPATPLAEQGSYLRCRIAVETREPSAAACLSGFRAAFRHSPHDLDALAQLVELAHARAGCAGAAALIEELADSYPRTTLAATWRSRCPEPP